MLRPMYEASFVKRVLVSGSVNGLIFRCSKGSGLFAGNFSADLRCSISLDGGNCTGGNSPFPLP
jgi:hypothetical protein